MTYVQDNDLTVDGAMTDLKGDRSKAPSQQADPDLYMHVVEEGPTASSSAAPAHQTGSINLTGISSCPPAQWARPIKTGF